jgi:hypothetical protein
MGGTCGTKEKKKCPQSFGRNTERKEIAWKTTHSGRIIFLKNLNNGKGDSGLDRPG